MARHLVSAVGPGRPAAPAPDSPGRVDRSGLAARRVSLGGIAGAAALIAALGAGTSISVAALLTARRVRRAAIQHAVLSYAFGAVIVALTINIVASLLGT